MKQRSLRLAFATLGALASVTLTTHADIVIMKDGKKFENATILSETADSVTFKYMLTPRIPDTLTKPKAEIAQLIKQRPEELEIVPLRKLLPSADLLTADKYEGIIQDQLRPFIAKYPGTAEAKEIEGMINTLQAEKEKVVSGQLKMDGEWLSAEDVKRDGHSIDAYRIRQEMKDLAAKNDWLGALRVWDKLSANDAGYQDTESFVKAIPEASKILETYKKDLERMLAEQPLIKKRRDDSIKSMVEPDLSRTKAAIKAEEDKYKTENEIEKKTKQRWLTVYKYDAKRIQEAQKVVVTEMSKLAAIDVNQLNTVVQAITKARRFLADANVDQADQALAQATASTGRNLNLTSAISKLRSEITRVRLEQKKQNTVKKQFGQPGALNTGTSSTTSDDRVAKALAEADRAKTEKKEEKESSSGGISSLNTSTTKAGSKASDDDDSKAKKTTRKSVSTAKAEEEGGGMQKYLLYGGIGLLVVLLSAMFLQKRQ